MADMMKVNPQTQLKKMMDSESVQARLKECLGKHSQQFTSSVLAVVNDNKLLQNADPKTILTSAMTAATLNLPIQKDLGFAWIVPYKTVAQFQMGYKGYIQLAMRTGQYSRMNATAVTEGAFKGYDDMGEPMIDWAKIDPDEDAVGYVFAFRMVNGFTKVEYWSRKKVEAHAMRYSQAYRYDKTNGRQSCPWSTDFDQMALKTVIKNTLSKWGILSVEMQKALAEDQSVDGEYVDNPGSGPSSRRSKLEQSIDVTPETPDEPPSSDPEPKKPAAKKEEPKAKEEKPEPKKEEKKEAPKEKPKPKPEPDPKDEKKEPEGEDDGQGGLPFGDAYTDMMNALDDKGVDPEEALNAFVSNGWLDDGQALKDLSESQMKQVVEHIDEFVAEIK